MSCISKALLQQCVYPHDDGQTVRLLFAAHINRDAAFEAQHAGCTPASALIISITSALLLERFVGLPFYDLENQMCHCACCIFCLCLLRGLRTGNLSYSGYFKQLSHLVPSLPSSAREQEKKINLPTGTNLLHFPLTTPFQRRTHLVCFWFQILFICLLCTSDNFSGLFATHRNGCPGQSPESEGRAATFMDNSPTSSGFRLTWNH